MEACREVVQIQLGFIENLNGKFGIQGRALQCKHYWIIAVNLGCLSLKEVILLKFGERYK